MTWRHYFSYWAKKVLTAGIQKHFHILQLNIKYHYLTYVDMTLLLRMVKYIHIVCPISVYEPLAVKVYEKSNESKWNCLNDQFHGVHSWFSPDYLKAGDLKEGFKCKYYETHSIYVSVSLYITLYMSLSHSIIVT